MLNAALFGFGIGSGLMGVATLFMVWRIYRKSQVQEDVILALVEYHEAMEEVRRQEELDEMLALAVGDAPGIEEI